MRGGEGRERERERVDRRVRAGEEMGRERREREYVHVGERMSESLSLAK